jgi:hypothetical protein
LLTVQADGVGLLDLDNARAPATGDPQDMLWDFGKRCPALDRSEDLISSWASFRTACQYSSGISSCGPRGGVTTVFLPIEAASFSICFGVGIRQLAGRSLIS